jgi:hypothetical protein
MKSSVGQRLTLLGLCAMIFYGYMLASGRLTLEIMPQFLVAAVIFLSSGRIMRRAAQLTGKGEEEKDEKPSRVELDWPWLTALLNWTCAFVVIGIMALLLLKPIDLSWSEAFSRASGPSHYFAGAVP